jgi:putative spermidine/putrescine transport system substrate-binding protein
MSVKRAIYMFKTKTPQRKEDSVMKGKPILILIFTCMLLSLVIGIKADAQDKGKLVINSWGGAWGQAIQLGLIDSFERETGIDVVLLSTWDVAKSKAAIQSGNPPPEDILDYDLPGAIALNRDRLLAEIDYKVFDKEDLEKIPTYARQPFALGWGQFAIGLCYDNEVFKTEAKQPKNWSDFWDFEKFPGKRGMLAWPNEAQPEFGLIADGVAPENLYPLDLERALAKLTELRPHVPKFPTSPAILGQMIVDRQVAMEACFTHRIQKLIDGGLTRLSISFDQARVQTEYFMVWKNAPNRENAMKFLAYIIKPQPQATWAQIGNTGPLNPAAFKHIAADVADKLPTSPSYKTIWPKNDEWYSSSGAGGKTNREVLEKMWNEWAAK